ncbi:MAG TPA: pitrilysin family protein [Pyrinomonadaceae bacterium]|nr:pitrilysin family protein [Pyrinomonadaceae bacterium]
MNEDFRKNAPAALSPRPFSIDAPFETTLSNNLRVVVFEQKRLPLVSFRLAFRSGEINDPHDLVGLTSATTHLLSQGTQSRSSREIAEAVERLGASLSASSSADNTIVSASALTIYRADILKLMAEMVLAPTFPENEIALYKQNTIENLKFQRSQPGFLADEQMSRILYGAHPYSIVAPSEANIEKLTRERVVEHHRSTFVPNNATMIVVGDVDKEHLINELETLFGAWRQGSVETQEFAALPMRKEMTLTIVDRKGSAQSNIVLSNHAIKRNHPDYFPFSVMNQILGAGASSRLFMNLREEKGYTYGAYSSLDARRLAGAFEATAEVRTPVTGDSLKEFFYELNRIRDEAVSEEELRDAKNFLAGVFPIRAETQEGLTNLIVQQQLYDLPADYLQTYRDNVNAVSIADVQRVANQYITPDKIAIVIVGDAEEVLPQAESYAGNIEIFDTNNNMQDISNYGKAAAEPTVDVSGDWNLVLEAMGQQIPVTLTLAQTDGKVSGSIQSMFGSGEIAGGKVSGSKISAAAQIEVQGQSLELSIDGVIEESRMEGSITAPMIPTPVSFTGTKSE